MELNKISFDENLTEKFRVVKEHEGLVGDKEVLRILISREYSRLQRRKYRKVFLPKETVELAEKAAEARNQTLYEYVEELALDMIKRAKEGEEHGKA